MSLVLKSHWRRCQLRGCRGFQQTWQPNLQDRPSVYVGVIRTPRLQAEYSSGSDMQQTGNRTIHRNICTVSHQIGIEGVFRHLAPTLYRTPESRMSSGDILSCFSLNNASTSSRHPGGYRGKSVAVVLPPQPPYHPKPRDPSVMWFFLFRLFSGETALNLNREAVGS